MRFFVVLMAFLGFISVASARTLCCVTEHEPGQEDYVTCGIDVVVERISDPLADPYFWKIYVDGFLACDETEPNVTCEMWIRPI